MKKNSTKVCAAFMIIFYCTSFTTIFAQEEPKETQSKVMYPVSPASFPGGDEKWFKFLSKNIHFFNNASMKAPSGKYKVFIQFTITTTGEVTEIKALSQNGFGMEDEAIRVIKTSPKWTPALMQGKAVPFVQRVPINFVVE
ncbi:MAG: energy transducer TonB [Ferruginibacter sp.]